MSQGWRLSAAHGCCRVQLHLRKTGYCLFVCLLKHWRDFGKCFPWKVNGMFVFTCGWPILLMRCGFLPGKQGFCLLKERIKKKENEKNRKGLFKMTESCKTDLKLPTWHSSPARWEEGTLSMQSAVSLCNVKMLRWSFGKARLEEII